jgi:hypothetical protein
LPEKGKEPDDGFDHENIWRAGKMRTTRRRWPSWLGLALVLAAFCGLGTTPSRADGKRLQVIQDAAAVRLDPNDGSPVIETLPRGSVLTLASSVKLKFNWFYVYFTSLESGNTREGYIRDDCVRKLFSTLKVIHISSGDEILNPAPIDFDSSYKPSLEWGTTRSEIIRAEGRPQSLDVSAGHEVLVYRREIMKKKCQLEYILDDRRLVGARLHLLENYADKNRYIQDYDRIRSFLTAKVGTPRADKVLWQDHSYEKQNDCWGIALSKGHVEFTSDWVFRDTEVRLKLAGGNDHVAFDAEINDIRAKKPSSL